MAMNFGEALRILVKTTPYVVLRLIVYLLVGIGAGLYLGLIILLARVFGGGAFFFIIGIIILGGILRLVRNYVLYMINAGHIAVITELIHKGSLPEGINQVEYGKTAVKSLFKEVSVLFVVDQLVKGTLKAINRTVVSIADMLPIPGLEAIARLISTVINFAVTYIDESILSYNFSRPKETVWESAKRGVVLYAMSWKPILKTAVGVAAVNLVSFVIFFLVLLIPFGSLAVMATSQGWKLFWFVMALSLSYSLKLALVNPFSLISMILTFQKSVEGQEPNKEWESKLESISGKFRELKEKAEKSFTKKPDEEPATA